MSSNHALHNRTSSASKADLRSSPRHKINIHLKISARMNGATRVIPGYARDISDSGVAAFIPTQLSVGHTVDIEFSFPGFGQTVSPLAIVPAVNKFQHGLDFLGPEQAARQRLHRHLASTPSVPR